MSAHAAVPSGVVAPSWKSEGDPTIKGAAGGGAVLTVHGTTPGSSLAVFELPASGWRWVGTAFPGYKYADTRGEHSPITGVTLQNRRSASRFAARGSRRSPAGRRGRSSCGSASACGRASA